MAVQESPETTDTSCAPQFIVRVPSQQHLDPITARTPAQTDATTTNSSIWNPTSEDTTTVMRPSTTGRDLEVSSLKQQRFGLHSSNLGRNTVARLRQHFEKESNQSDGEAGAAGERDQGPRRRRPIRSSFVPVKYKKVERDASDIRTTAHSGCVLPQFRFDPILKQPVEQTCSPAISEDVTQEDTLPVLQPTMYNGHYSLDTEPIDERLHNGSSLRLDEDMAVSQDRSDNGPGISVNSLAGPKDGASIIDFAYLYAAKKSSSPASGQKQVHPAPSAQYKFSSDDSTRNSSTHLIDLGEHEKIPPVVRSHELRAQMSVDNSDDTEEEELLLLPASVYVPQDMCLHGIVDASDDQKDLLIFSGPQITLPGPANDIVEQNSELTSAVEMKDNEDLEGTTGKSEVVLDLLPALMYTPPYLFISNIEEGLDDVHKAGASTVEEHSDRCSIRRTVLTLSSSERAHCSN